jgi:lysophospholipase L1-like esterase
MRTQVFLIGILVALSVFLFSHPAYAKPIFMGGEELSGGFYTIPYGVSADGSTVVGKSYGARGYEAFRWTSSGGMVWLGDVSARVFPGVAHAVSANGSTVVGEGRIAVEGPEAFRWTSGGGVVGLGDLPGGGVESTAHGVSADGSTVVGRGRNTLPYETGYEAFRWTSSGGMVGLGLYASSAFDVSADGSTVVGGGMPANFQAFRWTTSGGVLWLGDFPGGANSSLAYGVSADGSTVVGYGYSYSGREAFHWTSSSGMVGLGDLPGGSFSSEAYAVSADGSTVVGRSNSASGAETFIWDAANGMRELDVVLTTLGLDLTGWELSEAVDVSDDGRVIVGTGVNPSGYTEGWIVVLDEPLVEICNDGIDNDGDGETDLADPDCPIDYVAMGDSASSGEGVGSVLNKDVSSYIPESHCSDCDNGGKNYCHRSLLPHARILQASLYHTTLMTEAPIACSGAVTDNLRFSGGSSPETAPNEAPQLQRLLDGGPLTIVNESTDLITLTIGINDIGFADILIGCSLSGACDNTDSRYEVISIFNATIQQLSPKVRDVLVEIRGQAENAAVFLASYPHLVSPADINCFPFDQGERMMLREMASQVNYALCTAAQEAGVYFVPMLEKFEGPEPGELHDWCSDKRFFTELYYPARKFVKQQSFHPTKAGQYRYAVEIYRAIQTAIDAAQAAGELFPSGMPKNDPADREPCEVMATVESAVADLPAPKIRYLSVEYDAPPVCDTRGKFLPGDVVRFTGSGFAPSSSVNLSLVNRDESYDVIVSTVTAGANGDLDATMTLPNDIPLDEEIIVEAIGLRTDGGKMILLSSVLILDSAIADADGDVVPDICDICPVDPDPLQMDSDNDGSGDACDACPNDESDDVDHDGLCADVDSCELDPDNDLDGDGLCADVDPDNDGDRLEDWRETNTWIFVDANNTGTDPNNPDTDGDGVDDGDEVDAGTDPVPEPGGVLQLIAGGIGLTFLNKRRLRKKWGKSQASQCLS